MTCDPKNVECGPYQTLWNKSIVKCKNTENYEKLLYNSDEMPHW